MNEDGTESDELDAEAEASLKRLAGHTAIATIVLLGLTLAGAVWLHEPLSAFSNWVATELGLPGIFLGTMASDTVSFPIVPDVYLFVGVTSDLHEVAVLATVSTASILGGAVSYRLGPLLARIPFFARRLEPHHKKGRAFFRRYGVWAVLLAALSPLPFSIFCWLAGIYQMPQKPFLLACLARAPRFALYLYLFRLGWLPAPV